MNQLIRILLCGVAVTGSIACEQKPKTLEEKVKDGMDARPNEKMKDAGEDLKDATKDAKDAVKDAVK